jgi:methionine-rich copper-binding protein CopC
MKGKQTLLLAASLVCLGAAARAHPLPKSADPKPNSVLTTSPTEIRIGFSEGLELAFTGLEIDDAGGKIVATGDAALDPNDTKMLIVPLRAKLARGTYTVKWHAVGLDTHRVSGHYSFQVKA